MNVDPNVVPATLAAVIRDILMPAYAILPRALMSAEATVLLLAIGLQESRFEHRRQIHGPARGFWQFERGGGVVGVLSHEASRESAFVVCEYRDVTATTRHVYERLEHDDILAACFARLLLATDPKRLPALDNYSAAWDVYRRVWRPGRPHPNTWPGLYAKAVEAERGYSAP